MLICHWGLGLSEIVLKEPQGLEEMTLRFLNP